MRSHVYGAIPQIFRWGILGMACCSLDPTVRWQSSEPPAKLTRTDMSVISTVLVNVAGRPTGGVRRDILILADRTIEPAGMLAEDQLSQYTTGHTIPADVRNDMRRRNPNRAIVLSDYRPVPPGIRLADLSQKGTPAAGRVISQEEFQKRFPNSDGIVQIWLPGYSRDGKLACLRYVSDTTPHGNMGTYLLKKQGRKWIIVWRALSTFL